MENVAIIGHYGTKDNMHNGQTVKTKNLLFLLESTGNISVTKVDTSLFKRNNFKLLINSLLCLCRCRHIFLLVSTNGMRFYLPFLYYLNKIFRRKIYHYIIGSELLEMVQNNQKIVKYLNALSVNWFEYESGTKFLRSMGVKNVTTLTNFKMIKPIEMASSYHDDEGVFKFCTFSRVMEEKGITDAIEAIKLINQEVGKKIVHLDIYGPVENGYAEKLNTLLRENQLCVTYQGIVDSQSSVDILKDYYALIFPTRWAGEGVPGTIIDAYASGIPVIATDWNANREIITHNECGILYPNGTMKTLKDAVCWAIQHTTEIDQMRIKSREAYGNYSPASVLKVIVDEMKR